jgi:hypothetical protein
VRAGLLAEQGIDASAAIDPAGDPGLLESAQDPEHVRVVHHAAVAARGAERGLRGGSSGNWAAPLGI